MNATRAASIGAILSAAISSACCWLPLILIVAGVSAAGIATMFERVRPIFIGAASVLLAVGFYLNYFRRERCDNGECVRTNPPLRRVNRLMLWISAAMVIAFAFFPSYARLFARGKDATARTTATWVLRIDGMSCSGCEATVTSALTGVPGVVSATVNYDSARATVVVDAATPPSAALMTAAVAAAGYTVTETTTDSVPGFDPRIAGHWTATAKEEDGETFAIVLDIGNPDDRWVAEFDLTEYGVENYPVEIVRADSVVELHFTAMGVNFDGALSTDGNWLRGTASHSDGSEPDSLVFERTGDADLSALLIQLETTATDASDILALSTDAAELREAFNRDTDNVRLLLLLSPS